ncbi:MAG: DnaJ domain-containing protein [Bryobacterales bacterium]|nr:DnaJ domain-containing protein [Bryobacterales bacterium]
MASQNQPERRVRRRNNQSDPPSVYLIGFDANGQAQRLPAEILDLSDTGLKIQLRSALVRGVVYALETGVTLPSRQAKVTWCRSNFSSFFHAGLVFVEKAAPSAAPPPAAGDEDLYELLQVNAKATPDTLHRVYRILAQRHHPDNRETGDEDLFKRLTSAYETLSEPALRAAYDLSREQSHRTRARLFTSMESTQGRESERRKRAGVLNVLYARRVQDPVNPTLTVFDFEELLGVPRDHLEFTLWYLKERGYIARSDNNRFQITIGGVDYAESLDAQLQGGEPVRSDLLLPAAG